MGTPHTHPDRPTTQHPTPSLQKLHHGGKTKEITQLEQIKPEEDGSTILVPSLP
jgi:hypothetical protein